MSVGKKQHVTEKVSRLVFDGYPQGGFIETLYTSPTAPCCRSASTRPPPRPV